MRVGGRLSLRPGLLRDREQVDEHGGLGVPGRIQTDNACTPVATGASSNVGSAQLCQTDAECKTGTCEWQDCSVGSGLLSTQPSLTLCGIQSAAPFNCKAH